MPSWGRRPAASRGGRRDNGRVLPSVAKREFNSHEQQRQSAVRSKGSGKRHAVRGFRPRGEAVRKLRHRSPRDEDHDRCRLDSGHAVILAQFTEMVHSRTYEDFTSLELALDRVCQMYEQDLKMRGEKGEARYSVQDLWQFIDDIPDIVLLVYSAAAQEFRAHPRTWIKQQVLQHLKKSIP
mmetsp:Transcript_55122/g.129044  ORF Transcript_55122/g.129044 Transcript_55122/m.129044 type:complete len:181 (-) Transcript_55122:61-603(-)